MERRDALYAARGITDERDRLLSADDPLAELQQCCGGVIPGDLAVPALRDLVKQARSMGLRIAREFGAYDGTDMVSGFARVHPLDEDEGGGCEILLENLHHQPANHGSSHDMAQKLDAIDRASAEVTARLDGEQHLQLIEAEEGDTGDLLESVFAAPGKVWTEYVELSEVGHQQPLHWRLLDGARCALPGSDRNWRVRLLPIGPVEPVVRGFDLLFIADEPKAVSDAQGEKVSAAQSRMIGRTLTPVLRQPIARIIANAETIRAKLAGPLRSEYSEYAGNIAAAGQHLSGMLDDLADLEVVEEAGFTTIREKVNLADAARRAGGILGVRAQGRSITLDLPEGQDDIVAKAEFRRVLQILINLIGNAIAYSPHGTTISVTVANGSAGSVHVSVADQGAGITPEQAARIFDKFERLGRDSDGGKDKGSGLGLYISRRLARAMDGDLTVGDVKRSDDEEATGAVFTLSLPGHAL